MNAFKNMNLPNKLTVLRVFMVPLFMITLMCTKNMDDGTGKVALLIISALLFAGAAITDFIDGKIARRFNQISALGKVLDPVADKLTQITIAVMLFIDFKNADDKLINAFGWVFLVFLIKEAVMIIGGLVMLLMNIRPGAAEIWGKLATLVFYVGMVIIIAVGPEIGALNSMLGFELPSAITGIIVVVSAIMTIIAFLSYMPETFRQFKEHFAENKAAKTK